MGKFIGIFASGIGAVLAFEGIKFLMYGGIIYSLLYFALGAVFLYIGLGLLSNNKPTNKQRPSSSTQLKESPSNSFGLIEKYPSMTILTRYRDGKVYWDNSDSVIGSYDMSGNVFRADGKRIGIIDDYGDGTTRLILDRTFEWEWLLEKQYVKNEYKPAMGLMIARNYSSYIEPVIDRPDLDFQCLAYIAKNSETDKANLIGSSAAFIVAVYENLLDWQGNEFYLNAQKESYYLEKNGSNNYYCKYDRYKNVGVFINID